MPSAPASIWASATSNSAIPPYQGSAMSSAPSFKSELVRPLPPTSSDVTEGSKLRYSAIRPTSAESVIVQIADAISAARPGARRETLDNYIKRLENLENIAESFGGVEKAFAIQAGRELRILVNNESVSDDGAKQLCKDIAKKIESDLRYPGRIKVTIIRETRIVEYAR